jgi:DNA-binding LacI/PurR family transcriptional regulator
MSNKSGVPRKHDAVCATLVRIATEIGAGQKLPTTAELCRQLEISIATLNSALRTLEGQGVITRRSGVGIFASTSLGQQRIAVLIGSHLYSQQGVAHFWSIFLERVRKQASQQHQNIDIFVVNYSPETGRQILPDTFSEYHQLKGFDGVLAIGLTSDLTQELLPTALPIISFAGPSNDTVVIDNETVVRIGVQELARAGCQNIALWSSVNRDRPHTPYRGDSVASEIKKVFDSTLTELNLPINPLLIQSNHDLLQPPLYTTSLSKLEQGYRLAERTFGNAPDLPLPDGIISSDDMLTAGVLAYMRQFQIAVGQQVKIVTHSNAGSPVLLGWEKEIIRVEFNPEELVEALFQRLQARIQGDPAGKKIVIAPQLILPG